MPILKQDDLEKFYIEQNCILLDRYENTKQKLRFQCSCGNIWQATYGNFKHGQRCLDCGKKSNFDKRSLDTKYIKQFFLDANCELLSDYKGSDEKIKFRCKCGNISEISWSNFKIKKRCKECGLKKIGEDRKLTYEIIKKRFEDRGCILLNYPEVTRDIAIFLCVCGNKIERTVNDFFRNKDDTFTCFKCCNRTKYDHDFVEKYFEDNACKLLSQFQDRVSKVDYICSCGNIAKISFAEFLRGVRCIKCAAIKSAEKQRYSIEEIKEIFAKTDCILLSDTYTRNADKIKFICSCGTEYSLRITQFISGVRCMNCSIQSRTGKNNCNWVEDRERLKIEKAFRSRIHTMLSNVLKSLNLKKDNKTYKTLGYNNIDLINHITTHPNWENVKNEIWHLDHIWPISAFLHYRITDLALINSLENLQPLLMIDNLIKSDKYDKLDFENWLRSKGIKI